MKKYTTELFKLLALAIVTPMLVMAYTTIEKKVTTTPAKEATQETFTGTTPVSVGLMESPKAVSTVSDDSYTLVKYNGQSNDIDAKQNSAKSRFSLVIL